MARRANRRQLLAAWRPYKIGQRNSILGCRNHHSRDPRAVEYADCFFCARPAAVRRMAAAPEMGHRVRAGFLAPFLIALFVCAIPAHAGTYYVTVAGLGGEADYEQQFEGI